MADGRAFAWVDLSGLQIAFELARARVCLVVGPGAHAGGGARPPPQSGSREALALAGERPSSGCVRETQDVL